MEESRNISSPELAARVAAAVTGLAAATEHSASSAHQTIDRVSEATQPAISRAAAGAHHMVDRLSGTSSRVAHRLERATTRLIDAEQRLVGASSSYVRAHPLKTAGIALAAVFVMSQLVSSRKSPTGGQESAEKSAESDRATPAEDW